jgi:hypothetical protein
MELSDTVERISRKIEQKGITVDKKQIESKVRRLVEEFGVNPAEITVTSSYPSDGATWSVTAYEDNDGDVNNWSVQAFALCVTAN